MLKKVSLANGMDVEMYGESKILEHTEYTNVANARKFLAEMQNKEKIAEILTNDGGADGSVTVKIGAEENAPEGGAVVTTRVSLGENVSGSIGVIGPVRMNYKKVLSVLDKISEIIIDYVATQKQ